MDYDAAVVALTTLWTGLVRGLVLEGCPFLLNREKGYSSVLLVIYILKDIYVSARMLADHVSKGRNVAFSHSLFF